MTKASWWIMRKAITHSRLYRYSGLEWIIYDLKNWKGAERTISVHVNIKYGYFYTMLILTNHAFKRFHLELNSP